MSLEEHIDLCYRVSWPRLKDAGFIPEDEDLDNWIESNWTMLLKDQLDEGHRD